MGDCDGRQETQSHTQTRTDFVQGPAALTKLLNLKKDFFKKIRSVHYVMIKNPHFRVRDLTEILLSHRSHPEEKSCQRALDPTPKKI